MPILLQLGNAALVLLCKSIGVSSFAGSFAIQQSKTILARSCEAHPTERQHGGNEIKPAAILAPANFVRVHLLLISC